MEPNNSRPSGAPRYRVPDELRETLLDFTIAYLLERPNNLPEFGLNFFQRLQGGGGGGGAGPSRPAGAGAEGSRAPLNQARSQTSAPPTQPSATSASPSEASETSFDVTAGPPLKNAGRRKSVFAEAYNPEEDTDDSAPTTHPKSEEQRASLAGAVKPILLFRSLDSDQMSQVLDAMFEKKVKSGDYVIQQGDDGDNFYVIEKGKYKVFVKESEGAQPRMVGGYDGSGSFGELALMYNTPRAATVQAETDGSLWAMDRQTFRHIVLKNAYKKRQMYESLLNSVPMLKTMDNYERMNVADALIGRIFEDGDVIMKQGDAADGMYFIEDGTVRIIKKDDKGHDQEINRAANGGYFGELALLTKNPRAATVIAVGKVKAAFLDVEAFERLLGPCMDIMKRNVEDYEQQLIRIFGTKSAMTDLRSSSS